MTQYRIVEHCNRFSVEMLTAHFAKTILFGLIMIKKPWPEWVKADMVGHRYSQHSVGDYPASYDTLADARTEIKRWQERQKLEAQPKIIHEV